MIQSLLIPKHNVTYLSETDNCATALDFLEDQGKRCAPVLDATATLYRGNLYRYHIYQYHYHHPEVDLATIPVTHFLKNTTRVVHEHDSFFQLFFAMNDLPYIAVLNQHNTFLGIIEHNALLNFLAQAWSMPTTYYVLAVETLGGTGELAKISKYINRYCDISTAMTFEQTHYDTKAKVVFALPKSLDPVQFNQLVKSLERKHYQVETFKLK